jgi:phosphonate transport system substrate-binding protein
VITRRALISAAVSLAACRRQPPRPAGSATLVLSPAHGEALGEGDRTALAAALSTASGLTVGLIVAATPVEAIVTIGEGKAELGLLTVLEYLLAHQQYRVTARWQLLREEGATSYAGEIVVRSDSDIHDLRALDGRRVAFVDEYSMTGFVLPAKALVDAGAHPVSEVAGTHAGALAMLREGRADAAATFAHAAAGDASLRVLATTGSVPNEPLCARAGADEEVVRRVGEAFAKVAADAASPLRRVAGLTGTRPITDAAYAEVHGVVRAIGTSIEALVPQGRELAWSNTSPLFSGWP